MIQAPDVKCQFPKNFFLGSAKQQVTKSTYFSEKLFGAQDLFISNLRNRLLIGPACLPCFG
jgi:hypothetical protein